VLAHEAPTKLDEYERKLMKAATNLEMEGRIDLDAEAAAYDAKSRKPAPSTEAQS
jgi:hypothetical protein